MKTLKALAICSLLVVGGQAIAKPATTLITFEQGNACTSVEGDIKSQTFTLQTQAKQKITLKLDTIENIDRFRVKDPSGKFLKDIGNEHWEFHTKTAGKHTLVIRPQDNSEQVIKAKFEVCVR